MEEELDLTSLLEEETIRYTYFFEDEITKESVKFKKLGLNAKEIKAFLNGEDVVLYRKDFKRLKLNKNNE
jgi:hypothetical protein